MHCCQHRTLIGTRCPSACAMVHGRRPLGGGERRFQKHFTHLAFRVLLSNLHGPGTAPRSALQDSPWAGDGREYEPVVEHHVEDLVHILEAFDFVLLHERTAVRPESVDKKGFQLTSSTGAKYIPFSKAYRWNSLLPCTTSSRYVLSTGTVWESLCPA